MTKIKRISLLVVSFVILGSSIFGISKAFALPTRIEEQVTLLEYQHEGEFNYLVYLKPSYLFGPEPQEPPPNPKYPAEIVYSINMSFTYKGATETSQPVEIKAVLENPGIWQKEINLVPKTTRTGNFTIDVPLDIDEINELFDTIDEEIKMTTSLRTVSIVATVGDGSEVFTQSLPIKLGNAIIEVDSNLSFTQSGSTGKFDYTIHLKNNSLFDTETLKPTSVKPPLRTIGPGEELFSSLIDGMNVSFSYHLEASKPIGQLDAEVEIEVTIEDPEKWSKTIVLLPFTKKSGDFTITFPLDLNRFTEISSNIQQETGLSPSVSNLTIKANVHVTAQTDFGMIKEDFTQSITTDLRKSILTWDGDLEGFQSGSIHTTEIVQNQKKYLGLPVTGVRILSATVTGIIFILCMFFLVIYFRPDLEKPTEIERKAERAAKKYKDIIVGIKELPGVKEGETVISLDSLEDLIKAAQGLLKPVLHKAEKERHTYCVFDGVTRYEYTSAFSEILTTEQDASEQ